jgi:uncharacterized protein YjbI with pentapeptide repeats
MDTVDLEGANLRRVPPLDESSFYRCNLRYVLVEGDSLNGCYLSSTIMPNGDTITNVLAE